MNTTKNLLTTLFIGFLIYAILSLPGIQSGNPWETTGHDEEYIPSAALSANTYFDSNGNQQLDETDPMIFRDINFTVSTEFFQYPTHDERSGDGGFCIIVPKDKPFAISLNDSSEKLNKITDPDDQFTDSGSFRFKLIDKSNNTINPGMLNKSVTWEIEGNTHVRILIIGI